jgi:hypothetical protein
MKRIAFILTMTLMTWGCQENESTKKDSDLTGNQSVYVLQSGSQYAVSGTVVFKEKKDGTALINIELTGTDGDKLLPVHLHMGNTGVEGAAVAALLKPVDAATGKSETLLSKLSDESNITYQQLIDLEACVKVHLSSSGPEQSIVLAAGNIGKSAADNSGRIGIANCKSE